MILKSDTLNDVDYDILESERNLTRALRNEFIEPFKSKSRFLQSLRSFFPIIQWLLNYNCKEYLFVDVMGGLTAGILHVSQGIAYALMCGIPPVNGLYMSFFAPLIYMFFGTSRTTSLGTFAVIALMTADANKEIMRRYYPDDYSDIFEQNEYPGLDINPSTICSTLTFTIGLLQLSCAVLRFEHLTHYFSTPLVSGFTMAASIHVFFAQIFDVIGVKVRKTIEPFYLFTVAKKFIFAIPKTNLITLATSAITALILIIGKDYITPKAKKLTNGKLIIPFELIAMILGTVASYIFNFHDEHDVRIVGEVPTDIPIPQLPVMSIIPDCFSYALEITIMTIAIHISMAKVLAQKQDYKIDPGQEIYAISFSSIISGFFPVFPSSNGFGRSFVQMECGTRTQLCSLFSSLLLFFVIMFLAPLLRYLPRCVLSTIIIIAMRSVVNQNKRNEIKQIWKCSKTDFSIWFISFVTSIFVDVTVGLIFAIGYALITVVIRSQWPSWNSKISHPLITPDGKCLKRICIYEFESVIIFTNCEKFSRGVEKTLNKMIEGIPHIYEGDKLRYYFIFDCSAMTEIDSVGITAVKNALELITKTTNACIFFANPRKYVQRKLIRSGIIDEKMFIATIEKAVNTAKML